MKLTQVNTNMHILSIRNHLVYFSYETPIGFYDGDVDVCYISENIWSPTTGRHISRIKEAWHDEQYLTIDNDTFSTIIKRTFE